MYFIIIFCTVYRVQLHSILPLYLLCTSIARNWRSLLLLEGDIYCMREPLDELKTSRRYLLDWYLKNPAMLSSSIFAAHPFTYRKPRANNHICFSDRVQRALPRRKLVSLNAPTRHVQHLPKLPIAELFATAKLLRLSRKGVSFWCN